VKKILLIGKGQIGSALARDVTEFDVHIWPHDLDDLTREALEVIAPDAVINAAGKTDLAWCEANAREAIRSNLEAPVRLYERILQLEKATRFIHFSSGCVWDGPYTPDGLPFTPEVPSTPASLYSWTKAASDAMLMERNSERIAILRPRQVYSGYRHPRNTLLKLLKYPKLIDTPNSVSSIEVIEKTVRHILSAEHDWNGVWNVYDREVTTPLKMGELLAEAGLREVPQVISKEELDAFHKPKRVDTVLYDERFEAMIHPEGVQNQLSKAIEELKNTSQIP
jgi:nucleoside-diphosphate-sugar epimerase